MITAIHSLFRCVDLFAGPGGWDEGVLPFGIRPLGIEWDEAACATRAVAGHPTIRADVSVLDPFDFDAELLIASPPCQAFSVAGKGDGWKDVPLIYQTARALCDGEDIRAEALERCVDKRSLFVIEPLRWALALRPRWIAWEQVPGVLELWHVFADLLSRAGYECWAGTLQAERYGVPQTRERAFLLASTEGTPQPPSPTHQEYVFGQAAAEQHLLDGTVLKPWVSMAEAVGWGEEIEVKITRGAGMTKRHGDRPGRKATEPAFTVTGGGRSQGPRWTVRTGKNTMKHSRNAQDMVPYERPVSEPAPVVTAAAGAWKVGSEHKDPPMSWIHDRPATTIAGDSRVFQPGGHHEPGKQSQNAIRVTLEEAAVLQGFRRDYPFQGIKGKQFEQAGNAVPPPLAGAVIESLLGSELVRRRELWAA